MKILGKYDINKWKLKILRNVCKNKKKIIKERESFTEIKEFLKK